MYKKILVGFLLTAFISTSFSQELVYRLNEKFEDNSYIWSTGEWDDISSEVKNNEFLITRTSETSYHYFKHTDPIDYHKPFELSITIKHTSGDTDDCYGLIWAKNSEKAGHRLFAISASGSYIIGSSDGEKFTSDVSWTESSAIKGSGIYNELKLKGDGTDIHYLINDVEVESLPVPKIFGQISGVYIEGIKTLSVDQFYIKTPKREIILAKHQFEDHPPVNLGPGINSKYSEVLPVISPDGKELFFTRYQDPSNLGGDDDYDVFKATKLSDGSWSDAKRMPEPINSKSNNCAVGLPAGGNSLLLLNIFDKDGNYIEDGYSIARKKKHGWRNPEKIDIEGYYNYDDKMTANLSSNQTILLLSIFMEDSQEEDIYVSFLKKENHWTKPMNIGSIINGPGDEFSPFLAPDNKTMYFASTSHPGYGSADIFMTKRLDDTWTNWSEPQNLGTNINTSEWEGYFVIDASGEKAFIVSNSSGVGRADIFEVELPKESQPDPVLLIKGKVKDSKTSKPVESEIILQYTTNNTEAGHLWSDPDNGHYEAVLPDTGYYDVFAKAHGYYAYKQTIHTELQNEYKEIEYDLILVPLSKGQKIELRNIFFVRSKAEILPKSLTELDYLVEILTENPEIKILIAGHTDNTGSADLNQKLSQDRADKIKDYLIDQGIDKKRLDSKGYGGTKPLASNTTEATRRLNRRVEFTIK